MYMHVHVWLYRFWQAYVMYILGACIHIVVEQLRPLIIVVELHILWAIVYFEGVEVKMDHQSVSCIRLCKSQYGCVLY